MIQLSSTEGHWQSSPEILEEILKEPEMDSPGLGVVGYIKVKDWSAIV